MAKDIKHISSSGVWIPVKIKSKHSISRLKYRIQMKFFDEKYIELLQQKDRDGSLSKLARPAFRLATHPKGQSLRTSIDEFFENLPQNSQSRLRKKRNDFENISQVVNEIKVGIYLTKEGYKIEHEKKIDSLTPDWFVTTKNNKNFIVEVFTKTVRDNDKIENEYLTDIITLSKNISIGAGLCIRPQKNNKNIKWSNDLIRKIIFELEQWLKSSPSPNETIEIEEVEFELLNYSKKFNYVYYLITNEAFFVNSLPVKKLIENKVEKYRDICNKNNLPLVVACLPSFTTGIEKEEFEEICDDLFKNHPNLNSVWAFIEKEVEIFNNPKALFSI